MPGILPCSSAQRLQLKPRWVSWEPFLRNRVRKWVKVSRNSQKLPPLMPKYPNVRETWAPCQVRNVSTWTKGCPRRRGGQAGRPTWSKSALPRTRTIFRKCIETSTTASRSCTDKSCTRNQLSKTRKIQMKILPPCQIWQPRIRISTRCLFAGSRRGQKRKANGRRN